MPTTKDSVTEKVVTHTPGPWRVDRTGQHDASIRSAHFHVALVTSGLDDEPDRSQPVFDANCRLIAAAPCLLDALKALRDNVDRDLSGFWTESTSNFMQQADAAIAKAEGSARTVESSIERMTNDGSIGTGKYHESARSCGCDPGAGWICETHQKEGAL